jgi:hypothetical protein
MFKAPKIHSNLFLISILALLPAASAHADVFGEGNVDLQEGMHGDITMGVGSTAKGDRVSSLQIDLRDKPANPWVDKNPANVLEWLNAGFDPRLHLRIDGIQPTNPDGSTGDLQLRRLDIEVSGAAFSRQYFDNRTKSYTTDDKGEGNGAPLTSKEAAERIAKPGSTITLEGTHGCGELEWKVAKRAHCTEGLPNDVSKWTDEQTAEFKRRQVPIYRVTEKPSMSGEMILFDFSGVYRNDKDLGTSEAGLGMTMSRFSGQAAFTVEGIQFDLCGSTSVKAMIVGTAKAGKYDDAGYGSGRIDADACVGVQLGSLARLGYDLSFEYGSEGAANTPGHLDIEAANNTGIKTGVTQQLSLSHVLGSKVDVKFSRTHESMQEDLESPTKNFTTNMLSVGGSF